MKLEIITTIYIDTEAIITSILDDTFDDVEDAVNDYVYGLDDCDYHAIGTKEIEKIVEEVMKDPFVQKRLV